MSEQAIDRRLLVGPRLAADSWTMAWRLLKATPRQPELLMFSTIQTIMFVLLFRYVFGGAIETGGIPYVQFLMPGIFVQTLAFNGAVTGIGMADDMAKGIVDRFRSMPISPVAMFVGRATSDLVRATFMLVMMIVVGVLTGFRFHSSVERMPGWLQAFAKYNPITLIVNALRGWFDDGVRQTLHIHVAANAFQSLLWIAGVLAVFVPLCVMRFRRLSG